MGLPFIRLAEPLLDQEVAFVEVEVVVEVHGEEEEEEVEGNPLLSP